MSHGGNDLPLPHLEDGNNLSLTYRESNGSRQRVKVNVHGKVGVNKLVIYVADGKSVHP